MQSRSFNCFYKYWRTKFTLRYHFILDRYPETVQTNQPKLYQFNNWLIALRAFFFRIPIMVALFVLGVTMRWRQSVNMNSACTYINSNIKGLQFHIIRSYIHVGLSLSNIAHEGSIEYIYIMGYLELRRSWSWVTYLDISLNVQFKPNILSLKNYF